MGDMGDMKPGPFQKLLDEAKELGIDVEGFTSSPGDVDRLRMRMAHATEEVARAAVARAKLEAMPGIDEEEEFSGFDEAAGATRGVLVRLVEWSEWIPIKKDDNIQGLTVANGFTGFEAGENEKVVSIESLDTNRRKRVPMDDDPKKFIEYSLHVMKVVLANNVTTDLLHQLVDLQGGDREGTAPSASVILPDKPELNRAARRRKK